ncbi:MAG: hypothetical protein H6747_08520 [Deltaproteobacteria bacterium]|nr:hypothetical protein [Deltaproteobacteria bacterium]
MEPPTLGAGLVAALVAFVAFVALVAMIPSAADAAPKGSTQARLDYFVGPLVSGSRVVGLGGAYAAIAEGVDGQLMNPAAVAVRSSAFADEWFDLDFGFSRLQTLGGEIQLDRSPSASSAASGSATQFGLRLSFGRLGVAIHVLETNYDLEAPDDGGDLRGYTQGAAYGAIGLGWAFGRGEWVVGTLIAIGTGRIAQIGEGGGAVDFASAVAPRTFGVLWAPHGRRFRLGATVQLPVRMTQARAESFGGEPVTKLGERAVPTSIDIGGGLTLGAVWQLVGHAGNRPATFGEMAPPRLRWKGPPVIVATDLAITGPVDRGQGVLGYLRGVTDVSGEHISFSPRIGAESEVLERRLRVRTGSYFEPSRFTSTRGRVHWTGGADVRLSLWLDWRIGVVWDLAPHYRNTSLSLGLWH